MNSFNNNNIQKIFITGDKKLTGNINPTLLAAGKFHKNIAFNRNSFYEENSALILASTITVQNLKEELKNEFLS